LAFSREGAAMNSDDAMMLGAIVRCKSVFPFGCNIPLQSRHPTLNRVPAGVIVRLAEELF